MTPVGAVAVKSGRSATILNWDNRILLFMTPDKNKPDFKQIISDLKSRANPDNVAGMKKFGINTNKTLGISVTDLRKIGKKIGKDHFLAQKLWQTGIHEAKILASLVDEPDKVTSTQMDSWVKDFDSWDVCDQVCLNLFDKTPFVVHKINQWAKSEKEFVRRAAFALIACLAVHDKAEPDKTFIGFFPLIEKYSFDERNFVRKAVNWALRQIGKRNGKLRLRAISLAEKLRKSPQKSTRWIGRDAFSELSKYKFRK